MPWIVTEASWQPTQAPPIFTFTILPSTPTSLQSPPSALRWGLSSSTAWETRRNFRSSGVSGADSGARASVCSRTSSMARSLLAKGFAAGATRFCLRVIEGEAGILQPDHKIDRGACDVRNALAVDENLHAVALDYGIVGIDLGDKTHLILEASAAAGIDRDAQAFNGRTCSGNG